MLKRFPPNYRTDREMRDLQLEGLRWTVGHAWNNSPFYRKRLDESGVSPGSIRSLEDLARLPFTTADDLRDGYPLPLLAVPTRDVLRIHSSSGTTGKRKILCYTRKDLDDWQDMFARCYEMAGLSREDRVQICVGYGLWTAGAGFQLGVERFGAMAIPSGPGNLEMQCN
ncbi:MAG: phenylacetate--CoA ligase family protein, partial [Desulfobacteria bacterium]